MKFSINRKKLKITEKTKNMVTVKKIKNMI